MIPGKLGTISPGGNLDVSISYKFVFECTKKKKKIN